MMNLVTNIMVLVLAILLVLLLAAQVEMYRAIQELREFTGAIDRVEEVVLADDIRGRKASEMGLPTQLDAAPLGFAVFLSDKCLTCRSIAESLPSPLPLDIFVVLDQGSNRIPLNELEHRLDPQRTMIDEDRALMAALDLRVHPSVVVILHGKVESAAVTPSQRAFHRFVEEKRQTPLVEPSRSLHLSQGE